MVLHQNGHIDAGNKIKDLDTNLRSLSHVIFDKTLKYILKKANKDSLEQTVLAIGL